MIMSSAISTTDAIKLVTELVENGIHEKGSTTKFCAVVIMKMIKVFKRPNRSLVVIGVSSYLGAAYKKTALVCHRRWVQGVLHRYPTRGTALGANCW